MLSGISIVAWSRGPHDCIRVGEAAVPGPRTSVTLSLTAALGWKTVATNSSGNAPEQAQAEQQQASVNAAREKPNVPSKYPAVAEALQAIEAHADAC